MSEAKITLSAQDKTGAAFASVRGRFAGLSADAGQVGRALSGIGVQFSAALVGAGFVAMAKSTVDALDKLNDLSDATGSSIENLSALEDIAARTGTSMDTAGSAVIKLNKALGEAKPGSDQAAALEAIGLSADKLKQLDPAEALRQVAVALSGFANDGNKARLTQELFGKSLAEVAPLLKDLAEKGTLNAKVTTEQAQRAEDFNKQLFELKKNSEDAARSIVNTMLPALNDFGVRIKAAADDTKSIGERLAQLFGAAKSFGFGALLGLNNDELNLLKDAQAELSNIERALQRQDISEQRRADLESKRIGRLQTIAKLQREASASFSPSQNYGDTKQSVPKLRDQKTSSGPSVSESDKYLAKLRESILQTANLSAAEQARIDINRGLLGVLTDAQRTQIIGLAASLDAVKALQDAEKQAAALAERGRSFSLRFQTEQEKQAALMQEADDLVAKSAITWTTYGRVATTALQDSIAELNKVAGSLPKLSEPFREMSLFAEEAARNIQDTLGETMEQVLAGNFSDIGKLWANTLKKMAAQAAAAKLNSYLFGDTFNQKGGGSDTGALGDLVKLFGSFGGARAMGGPVSAGRPYLVGEQGPELFAPGAAGMVMPNSALGGTQITYAPVFQFTDASAEQMARIRAVARAEYARFARQMSVQGAA